MSIRFKQNFIVAQKVLASINKKMNKKMAKDCSVECLSNGREQGYSIVKFYNPALRVSFSENRKNNDIVVYAGKDVEFSMQGNVPNEKVYHEAKYFRYDKVDEAAQFVVDFFNGE
jgi:hypothetical protein